MVFGLPGTWIDLDLTNFDCFGDTGEVSWLPNPLGLYFDEMELTYTAGFSTAPDPAKFACVQLVRNAQATPALNLKEGDLNDMHLTYFADTLLDATVQAMLAPDAAKRKGDMSETQLQMGGIAGRCFASRRFADAIVRSFGASEITIRVPDPSSGDTGSQLGPGSSAGRGPTSFPALLRTLPPAADGSKAHRGR